MSERTPARPTGATEEQIEAAVRRGIPETMDWKFSARCTVLMSIRDAAALLVPPGYSIVPDDQEEAATEVTGIAEQLATLNESVYRINRRLDGLESAAKPATDNNDPLCATCQHPLSCHNQGGCCPTKTGVFGPLLCPCKAFVPMTAPVPDDPICQRPGCGHPKSWHCYQFRGQHLNTCSDCMCEAFLDPSPVTPPDDIDPVLFDIAEAYRKFYAEGSGETDMDGMPELRVAYRARSGVIGDVHEEMLAYGRTS